MSRARSRWSRTAALAAGTLLAFAAGAQAGTIGFSVFENADGVSLAGLDVFVEIEGVNLDADADFEAVDFTFRNHSTIGSTVTTVYFESSFGSLLTLSGSGIQAESSGVDFQDVDAPGGSLPGHTVLASAPWNNPWSSAAFSSKKSGSASNGIDEGATEDEYLTLRFLLSGSTSVAQILAGITTDNRIGVHIQRIGPGARSSVSAITTTTTVVPLPPAAWMALGTLGLLGAVRLHRRRRAQV